MANANTNTQLKDKNQNPPKPPMPPAALLTFRKPLIILAHIIIFAVSLMFSFLLANNMQFRHRWLVEQYPLLLCFFILSRLCTNYQTGNSLRYCLRQRSFRILYSCLSCFLEMMQLSLLYLPKASCTTNTLQLTYSLQYHICALP